MPSNADKNEEEISRMESGINGSDSDSESKGFCSSSIIVTNAQKVVAELIGTYFVIFAGCGSVAVNKIYGGTVTFPGICVTWGLIVMVMIYTVGYVSGAHFNPSVTITSALFRRFPWKEVPLYIVAQLMGSILASCTLAIMFNVTAESYFGTLPVGSNGQSLAIEIVISFLLMFVVSGASTDPRAIGELGGVAVGMTIILNVFVAGYINDNFFDNRSDGSKSIEWVKYLPISGASMNPARSIGPAIVKQEFRGLWIYVVGPIVGTICGAFSYNLIRSTNKPFSELTTTPSFLKTKPKDDPN